MAVKTVMSFINTRGKDIDFLIFTEKVNLALENIYDQNLTYSRWRNNFFLYQHVHTGLMQMYTILWV